MLDGFSFAQFMIFLRIIIMLASFIATRMSSPVKFSDSKASSSKSLSRQYCDDGRKCLMMFSRSPKDGTSMRILRSKRRKKAWSISLENWRLARDETESENPHHGMFVDPNTKTFPFSSLSSPSSSDRNSFFKRFDASCSLEHRFVVKLSNSSMKIIDGAWNLASSNNTRMSFSDSPRHFEIKVLAATLKNVKSLCVVEHKALASIVLPQPGTPCSSTAEVKQD